MRQTNAHTHAMQLWRLSWWRHQMKTFSALLAIRAENTPVPGEFPAHKGQWRGALMFFLLCVWINDWVKHREAGDVRRYCAHYHVTVMSSAWLWLKYSSRITKDYLQTILTEHISRWDHDNTLHRKVCWGLGILYLWRTYLYQHCYFNDALIIKALVFDVCMRPRFLHSFVFFLITLVTYYVHIKTLFGAEFVHMHVVSVQLRHSGRDGVSNHQPHHSFSQPFIQTQIEENIKAPRLWPLCGEFTGDRWIPRTNGQ